MEEPGSVGAAASPAATTISAEIDTLFADATGETESSSTETTSPASETNPQDSTVQPSSPIDFENEPADDEPASEEAAPPAEKPAVEAAPPPVAEEDREGEEYEQRGKKWIRYPEARGKEVFAGYQAARTLSKELGLDGPVTPDTIKSLASDKTLLDSIDFDTMSADPAEQARAFSYLFKTARKAYEGGHTAYNPHETMADALLHAASTAAPEVIQGLEQRINAHTFDNLYKKAVAAGLDTEAGRELLASVQRADQALTGNYRKRAELTKQPAPDPLSERVQQIERREQTIEQQEAAQAKAEWDYWNNGTKAAIETNISGAIAAAIKPVLTSLKNFPETRKNVEIRLREELKHVFLTDQRFAGERERFYKQAAIAGNESIRDGWRARLIQLYTSRAEQVLREKAPAILSESATAIKAKSDKTHERLKGTQSLRGTPAGGIAPNGASAPTPGGGKFDSKSWSQEFDAVFS